MKRFVILSSLAALLIAPYGVKVDSQLTSNGYRFYTWRQEYAWAIGWHGVVDVVPDRSSYLRIRVPGFRDNDGMATGLTVLEASAVHNWPEDVAGNTRTWEIVAATPFVKVFLALEADGRPWWFRIGWPACCEDWTPGAVHGMPVLTLDWDIYDGPSVSFIAWR